MKNEQDAGRRPFKLGFCAEKGKTLTKITVSKSKSLDTLVFANDSNKTLTIEIDDPEALFDENKKLVNRFEVGAGKSRAFTIGLPGGSRFKYSATIEGNQTEDPIIILED